MQRDHDGGDGGEGEGPTELGGVNVAGGGGGDGGNRRRSRRAGAYTNSEQLRREHEEAVQNLGRLKAQSEDEDGKSIQHREQQRVERRRMIGLDVSKLPQSFRSAYVSIRNFIESPEERAEAIRYKLKKQTEELGDVVEGFSKDIDAFSEQSDTIEEELNNLGEILDGYKELKTATYARIQQCKQIMENASSHERTEAQKLKRGLETNLRQWEREEDQYVRKLQRTQVRYELGLQLVSTHEGLYNQFCEQEREVSPLVESQFSLEDEADLDHRVKVGRQVLEEIQGTANEFAAFKRELNDNNYERMVNLAKTARINLKIDPGQPQRPNPFIETLRERESQKEEIDQTVKQILSGEYFKQVRGKYLKRED